MYQQVLSAESTIQKSDKLSKILVISRAFFPKEGGIEEYVYNRCLQDPQQVIVLASSYPGDKAFDQEQAFAVYRWFLPTIPGKLGSLIKQIFNMIGSFFLAIGLYFRYRYHYIEWGHGYDFPSLLLLTYLLPVKCFVYLHGDDLLCPLKNPVFRSLFSLTLKRSAGIVCNSAFTCDYLKQNFKINTPTYIINPTVRPQKFGIQTPEDIHPEARSQVLQKYGIPETAIVILSVGRLVNRKGFDRILKSLPHLLAEGLDVHYLIAGRGVMESELRLLSQSLGIKKRVHFAGYVPDTELAEYYLACDIFAMITFFDTQDASIEGFGIVYREAGFFGKPVIAARIGGVVDAVHHEENGLLVDSNSPDEIVNAFSRLCQDPQLRAKLGEKGREIAKEQTPHSSIYK
ncbi:glycosyltransferase family 4 protein [Anabaena sphaerica FACHB-251]|uniref:Glycosyltransferase family 4 protein n=1 Tax=Anabaena sphaerica FACHB-251 TaxID=2692883 RepID=A0A926ZYU0_9NOST|nr:glycosyltransferase family 4 protein [Anabaena sphaerica]MBD2293062.1 glycosyltransferase family 4 protein [Anabaena sphaerica FACHB-251]